MVNISYLTVKDLNTCYLSENNIIGIIILQRIRALHCCICAVTSRSVFRSLPTGNSLTDQYQI
jgi:hypothetical protein